MLLGFALSPLHLLIVLAVVLLLFGHRLPMVARSLGRSLTEFKKGVKEVDDDSANSQIDDQDRPRVDEHARTSRERVAR